MKLETLHIDQFGKFSEESFSFSEVTVFYGPNESGKTTLFDAILMQLCKPTKTTKLGKALHQRYRKRITCRLQLASSSEVFDEPLDSDDFMNLQAIRAGDVHLELDDKRSWVQQLKQKLSGNRIAPELIYKALEPLAATGSNRTINKEIAELEATKLQLTQEIQHLTNRRHSLLAKERENATMEKQLLGLKASQTQTLKEITTLETQLGNLKEAIKREDVEQELDRLYGYQQAVAKLRSLRAFSAEQQATLHRLQEAKQALDEKQKQIGRRIQQASQFKLSALDIIGLVVAASLSGLTYALWPASLSAYPSWAQQLSPVHVHITSAVLMTLLVGLRLKKHLDNKKSLVQEEFALVTEINGLSSSIHQILEESGARSPKEFDQLAAAREAQEQIMNTHYHRFPYRDNEAELERAIKERERQLNHFDDKQIYTLDRAKQRLSELEIKLKRLHSEERGTIDQIITLEADFQRRAGEIKGSFGELPEKILELEKRLAAVQEQLGQKLILKQGAAIALSIIDDMVQDSDLDFERLALLTNNFIGKFLSGRSITMTKLNLHKITFTDQYAQIQKPEHLSSGTRDLFVFALRLILFAQVAPRIPLLIFDDPFIHLDEDRIDTALAMLKYFIEHEVPNLQVVLFTKSLHLANKVEETLKNVSVVNLSLAIGGKSGSEGGANMYESRPGHAP